MALPLVALLTPGGVPLDGIGPGCKVHSGFIRKQHVASRGAPSGGSCAGNHRRTCGLEVSVSVDLTSSCSRRRPLWWTAPLQDKQGVLVPDRGCPQGSSMPGPAQSPGFLETLLGSRLHQ